MVSPRWGLAGIGQILLPFSPQYLGSCAPKFDPEIWWSSTGGRSVMGVRKREREFWVFSVCVFETAVYLTGYRDYLTGFREPLSPPYRCGSGLKRLARSLDSAGRECLLALSLFQICCNFLLLLQSLVRLPSLCAKPSSSFSSKPRVHFFFLTF